MCKGMFFYSVSLWKEGKHGELDCNQETSVLRLSVRILFFTISFLSRIFQKRKCSGNGSVFLVAPYLFLELSVLASSACDHAAVL